MTGELLCLQMGSLFISNLVALNHVHIIDSGIIIIIITIIIVCCLLCCTYTTANVFSRVHS